MKQWSWFKVVLCITLVAFSIPLFARSYSSSSSSSGTKSSSSSSYSSTSSRSYSTPKSYSNSSGTSRSYSSSPSQTPKASAGNVYNSSGTSRSYSTPANSTPVNYYSPNSASSLSQPITKVSRSTTARRPYYSPQRVVYSDSGNGLLTGVLVGSMMSNHNNGYYQQPYNAQVATPVVSQQASVSPDKVGPFKENVAKIPVRTSATHKVMVAFVWVAVLLFITFAIILGYKIYKRKTRVSIHHMSY